MGNYIVKKGILLDERDFETGLHATLDGLAETVCAYLHNAFGHLDPEMDDTPPWLEIDGIVSERFEAAYIDTCPWTRMHWINPTGGFRAALLEECKWLDLPNIEHLLDLVDAEPEAAEPTFRTAACEAVMAGCYHAAENLISALADIRSTGIPAVRPAGHFSRDGDERLYDFREQRHPVGTRLLAEIGFNWGQ